MPTSSNSIVYGWVPILEVWFGIFISFGRAVLAGLHYAAFYSLSEGAIVEGFRESLMSYLHGRGFCCGVHWLGCGLPALGKGEDLMKYLA